MASAHDGTRYLVGLIGSTIGTSLSPSLHEHEADALGLRYLYRILDLTEIDTDVGDLLHAAQLAGYDGLNITHPVKQLVLPYLDELSPDAAAVGAVNTVVLDQGRAVGHNTDLTGFARALSTGLPHADLSHVVQLGAGGAGAAVAHALLSLGTGHLTVVDVDETRATHLMQNLQTRFGQERASAGTLDALASADGLVHATPVGMEGNPGMPLPVELLRPELWVADIVYRPLDTELLHAARALGCAVLHGGRMVVFQAADSLRLITGREPDPERMLRHFDEIVPNAPAGR